MSNRKHKRIEDAWLLTIGEAAVEDGYRAYKEDYDRRQLALSDTRTELRADGALIPKVFGG